MTEAIQETLVKNDSKTNDEKFKFTISNQSLSLALRKLSGIVDHTQVIQVLSFIKCTLEKNSLLMISSNSEIEMHTRADVIENSSTSARTFTLPCKKLLDITRSLAPDAMLDICQQGSWTSIRVNKTSFKLASLPAENFPQLESFSQMVSLKLQQDSLLWMLKRTAFAMANQDVRFFLNGILLKIEDNCLSTIATDGHRLAFNTLETLPDSIADGNFIIPRKTIQELCKHLQDDSSDVRISIGDQHIGFTTDSMILFSNLIEGQYPDYNKLIPKVFNQESIVNTGQLQSSLSRLITLANEKYHGAKFSFSDQGLVITTHNINQEEAKDTIDATLQGERIELGFNIHYVVDILTAIKTSCVKISIVDADHSVLFQEHASEEDIEEGIEPNNNSLFIVMPLSI